MAVETPKNTKRKDAINDTVYTIKFGGNYFANDVDGLTQKAYTLTVKMKHEHVNKEGAKSVFKNVIAPKLMPQKYPDYVSLATYHILASECDRPELLEGNLKLLTTDGLLSYIENEELDINVHLYDNEDDLRNAIISYQEDPDMYQKAEEILAAKLGKKLELKGDVLSLNKELSDDDFELAEQLPEAPAKKGKSSTKEDDKGSINNV